jgi:plasmid stabilization system protein ParE
VRVRFTASAEADIEQIAARIVEADPERVRLTLRGLRAAARSIGLMPYVSSPVPSASATRKKSVRPYILLFTIRGGEVIILRIAHERSDWISLV